MQRQLQKAIETVGKDKNGKIVRAVTHRSNGFVKVRVGCGVVSTSQGMTKRAEKGYKKW